MNEPYTISGDSSAVQTHLTILQDTIRRMADNSRSCKMWCVTLVSAILVLVARVGDANHAFIALLPTLLFFVMDAYYLALERSFRVAYNGFVAKIHAGQYAASDLYVVRPSESVMKGTLWAMFRSFSVLPFYALVIGTLLLVWRLMLTYP